MFLQNIVWEVKTQSFNPSFLKLIKMVTYFKNMFIIVGLGNPGEKFKKTRHNVGFMTVDAFAKEKSFPDFVLSKKYSALVSEKNDVTLVKPQTLMNESGKAVKKITTHYSLLTTNLIVINDDIDLPLGKLKITKGSGSGGHKGVESIIQALGTKDFVRVRVGICPERGKPNAVEKFVIKKFTKEEREIIDKTIAHAANALNFLIENGLEKTMNQFN